MRRQDSNEGLQVLRALFEGMPKDEEGLVDAGAWAKMVQDKQDALAPHFSKMALKVIEKTCSQCPDGDVWSWDDFDEERSNLTRRWISERREATTDIHAKKKGLQLMRACFDILDPIPGAT